MLEWYLRMQELGCTLAIKDDQGNVKEVEFFL